MSHWGDLSSWILYFFLHRCARGSPETPEVAATGLQPVLLPTELNAGSAPYLGLVYREKWLWS